MILTLTSLAQIILINIILSGDNALMIAMAARHLPERQQRIAMIWGGTLAVVLQLLLTLGVSYLLLIPGLRFVSAILLLGIACKLVQDEEATAHEGSPAPTSLRTAVFRIAIANLVMSLDNTLAIASVSGTASALQAVCLALSIIAILLFSQVILKLINRFRWIVYLGTGVLALTAAGMILHDLREVPSQIHVAWPVDQLPIWIDWGIRTAAVLACFTSGYWWPRRTLAYDPH